MTGGPERPGEPEGRLLERLALLAYPRRFRRRYGAELRAFWARQRREPRYRGPLGGARFVAELAWDAVRGGARARADARAARRRGVDGASPGGWPGGWGFEARTGLRSLARTPGFALTVTLTLGLGIGSATAVYSIADWIVLRPVPGVRGHDRVLTVRFQHETRPGGWFLVSHPDFLDLRAGTPALSHLGGTYRADAHVAFPGASAPRRLPAELVTDGYFGALGVTAALGRLPGPAASGADPRVAVLSHRVWRAELAGDPAVIGRALTVNGQPFTVVGVAPPRFHGPAPAERATDLWMPVEAHEAAIPNYPADILSRRRGSLYFTLLGRLAPGAGQAAAEAQLAAAREAVVEASGGDSSLDRFVPVVEAGVGVSPWVRERADTTMRILLAAVAVLLLLGCANAGNLLLARAHARGRDLAVRRALGATGGRIAGRLVVQGLLLGALGGAAGLALARLLLLLYGGERFVAWLPTLETVPLDGRVVLFAAAVSVATGVLFSLAPAVSTARGAGAGRLRSGTRVAGGVRGLRRALVGVQVALSLGLVVGAGLLLDSVRELGRVELGFAPRGVVEATMDPGTQGYDPGERDAFWREVLERARRLPGAGAAGLAYAPLHGRMRADTEARPEGAPEDEGVDADSNLVSEGFLAAAGIPLVAGRDFRPDEVMADPPRDVVIVSESLARALFGGTAEAALGRRIDLAWRDDRSFEVVGVSGDIRGTGVKRDEANLVLEPLGQMWNAPWATLYLRSGRPPGEAAAALRGAVRELDRALPLYDVQPLTERVASSFSEERLLARLTALFGGLALLLAALGLYGVMTYATSARTRELGVRLALGAGAGRVRRMMLAQGLGLVALGLPPGLLLAVLASRLVASRLFGVAPFDPAIWGAAAATLLAAGALASWLPAWRATRIDPAETLRGE